MPTVSYTLDNSLITQPAIMSSAWQASDGTMGIVLFNISQAPQRLSVSRSMAPDYPVIAHGSMQWRQYNPDGSMTDLGTLTGTTQVFSGTMGPDEIILYELEDLTPADCAAVIAGGYGLPADVNEDCDVNMVDLTILADAWLSCQADLTADMTNDDCAMLEDFAVLANEWNQCNDPTDTTGRCQATW